MKVAPAARDFRTAAMIAAAFLCLYGASLILMPRDGFWVVDNANKYLQLQALSTSGGASANLPIGALQARIDPSGTWNPLPFPFSVTRDAKVYSIFSPVFAFISLPFYALLSWTGLYLLPLCGGIGIVLGVRRLATLVAPGDRDIAWLAPVLAGVCTPVWFYSLEFWEHTPAVALVIWGLFHLLRFLEGDRTRDLVVGGVLLALAIYLRDELYLLALVAIAAPAATRRGRGVRPALVLAATMVGTLVPLWLLQWHWLGAPFGFHGAAHLGAAPSLGQHLASRPAVFQAMFLSFARSRALSIAIGLPLIALFLFGVRTPAARPWRLLVPVSLAGLAAAALFAQGLLAADGPIVHLLRASNGFFGAAPLVVLGLAAPARGQGKPAARLSPAETALRRLRVIMVGYALLYLLVAPLLGAVGIHWGNRFLLLLYPLLSLTAAIQVRRVMRGDAAATIPVKACVGLVVAASLVMQVGSVWLLREKKVYSHQLNERIEALQAPVVVTDIWWAPQEMYRQFPRAVFLVRSDQDLAALDARLAAAGFGQVVFVTRPGHRISGRQLSTIRDGKLRFYGLAFYQHPTAPQVP